MTRASSNDLDYLATRLHARRSRMLEGSRLDDLCGVRTLSELGHAAFPGFEFSTTLELQRRLVQSLAQEISGCLKHLDEDAQGLIAWVLTRFELENIKILLRGFLNHTPPEDLQPHLVDLPHGFKLDAANLLEAKSLEDFVGRLPASVPRHRLDAVVMGQREPPPLFMLEAALDHDYFRELITRSGRLHGGEEEIIKPLVFQESNLFQFMVVARGRFHFKLSADVLRPLRLGRSGADDWFSNLLSAPDLPTMVKYAAGVIIDAAPTVRTLAGEPANIHISDIEALAWQRYLRLANSVFRRSHMGAAAVAGYFGIRRMEIANLISLSEGIRLGIGEKNLRARMYPRTELEEAHV